MRARLFDWLFPLGLLLALTACAEQHRGEVEQPPFYVHFATSVPAADRETWGAAAADLNEPAFAATGEYLYFVASGPAGDVCGVEIRKIDDISSRYTVARGRCLTVVEYAGELEQHLAQQALAELGKFRSSRPALPLEVYLLDVPEDAARVWRMVVDGWNKQAGLDVLVLRTEPPAGRCGVYVSPGGLPIDQPDPWSDGCVMRIEYDPSRPWCGAGHQLGHALGLWHRDDTVMAAEGCAFVMPGWKIGVDLNALLAGGDP